MKDDINHLSNAFNAQTNAHATYDKLVWIEAIPGSEVNRLLLIKVPRSNILVVEIFVS